MTVSVPAYLPHQFSNTSTRYSCSPYAMSHPMAHENALGLHMHSSDSAYYSNGSSHKLHSNDSSVTPEPETSYRDDRSFSKDSLRSSQPTSPSAGPSSVGEHKNHDSSPKRSPDTGEDNGDKRSKFLKRNRVAASKCRQKKKQWVEQLTQMHDNLEATNGMLHQEFNAIKEQVSMVKNQLMGHASCKDANIDQWFKNEAARFVHAPSEPSVLPPMLSITPQFASVQPHAMPTHVMVPSQMHAQVHQHAIPHHSHPHSHPHHAAHMHTQPIMPELVSIPGPMTVTLPQTIQPASMHYAPPPTTVCNAEGLPMMTTAPAPAPILDQSFCSPPILPPIMSTLAPAPSMAAVSSVGMEMPLQSTVSMEMSLPAGVSMEMPVSSMPISMPLQLAAVSTVDLAMNPAIAMTMAGQMPSYPPQKF